MDAFTDYESFDGVSLASLIRHRIISPLELLNAAIQRIEQRNPTLNAVIYKMYDYARHYIQQDIPQGIFQGVPFLLKDLLADCEGSPMHFGSKIASHYVSQHDSELVKRFKQAGLVIVGKTNTPEFGLSPTTEPDLFGPTLNPWDLTKSAGGSSGGSAAAVASGMVPMAHGGDGAGSLRIPAAYCGIFGLKPSRGRTPAGSSVMRIWQGMVTEHVMTRSVRDNAAMLDVLSGPELGSLISLPKPKQSFLACLQDSLKPLRIALIQQPFFPSFVSDEYIEATQKAGKLCESLGHHVEPAIFDIQHADVAQAYLIIVAGETAVMVQTLVKMLKKKFNEHQLESPTAILCEAAKHFSAADFAWASHVLDRVTRQGAEFFQNYDIMLTPTMPVSPPPIGAMKPDRLENSLLHVLKHVPYGPLLRKLACRISTKQFSVVPFTPLFNMTGQPAMSVPLYWDSQGLPIGIQFVGRFCEEQILLKLAYQLEKAQPWMDKRPNITSMSG